MWLDNAKLEVLHAEAMDNCSIVEQGKFFINGSYHLAISH